LALTDEQRAMLQLLLEGGQGYEDIGSLLGISPDQVRSRAREALTEMGGADPDAQVGLTDYLLGQADPIGRADAVRQLQNDPEANALAQRLLAQLRLLAPKAELPDIPPARGGRRAAPAPPPQAAPSEPAPPPPPSAPPERRGPAGPGFAARVAGFFSGLGGGDKRRMQLIVAGACALVLAVAVVVVAVSGGGDGGDGDECNTIDSSQAQDAGVPTIQLKAVGPEAEAECPPSGQVTLAPVEAQGQNQSGGLALQANAADLEPTSEGEVYVMWLYNSDEQALPLGQQTVSENGDLTGGIPLVPQQILLIGAFESIRLARTSAADAQGIQQALQQSLRKQSERPVPFVGEPVLEGPVSELGLEQLLQQLQGQAQAGGGGGAGNAGQGGGGTGQ
jgi:transposase-like protein